MTEQLANLLLARADQLQLPTRLDRPDTAHHARVTGAAPPVSSDQVRQATSAEAREPLSKEELEEMLRRMNLTLDVFEIEARYSISEEDHLVKVTLINTRTGEVIRHIPPDEFQTAWLRESGAQHSLDNDGE